MKPLIKKKKTTNAQRQVLQHPHAARVGGASHGHHVARRSPRLGVCVVLGGWGVCGSKGGEVAFGRFCRHYCCCWRLEVTNLLTGAAGGAAGQRVDVEAVGGDGDGGAACKWGAGGKEDLVTFTKHNNHDEAGILGPFTHNTNNDRKQTHLDPRLRMRKPAAA